MLDRLFSDKQNVVVYFPSVEMSIATAEVFLVELFDLVAAFLEPIKFGVHKNDILEYLEKESQCGRTLLEFLEEKRYIATEDSFLALAQKYTLLSQSKAGPLVLFKGEFSLGTDEEVTDLMERIAKTMKEGRFVEKFKKEMFTND